MIIDGPGVLTCSRSGCREAPTWNVNWRNPRIHGVDRVKVWLACDAHREVLRDHLATRDFPVAISPLGVSVTRVEAG